MEKSIKLMPTKKGNGYKVVVDGVWFYTSVGEISKMLAGKVAACQFRSIADLAPVAQEVASL